MNLGVQQITHEQHALLGNVNREITGTMAATFRCNLKRQTTEVQRHITVETYVRRRQFSSFVARVPWIVGIFPLVKLLPLLHLKIVDLVFGSYVNGFILAKVPSARGMVACAVRGNQIPDFFVCQLSYPSHGLVCVINMKVKNQHAIVGDNNGGVAGALGVLKHIHSLRNLDGCHSHGSSSAHAEETNEYDENGNLLSHELLLVPCSFRFVFFDNHSSSGAILK